MKMKPTTLLEYGVFVTAAHGATFRLPVVSNPSSTESLPSVVERALRSQPQQSSEQPVRSGPIGDFENDEEYMDYIKQSSTTSNIRSSTYFPLWDWNELMYTVPINIGTPPQPLNALLSISGPDLLFGTRLPSLDSFLSTLDSDVLVSSHTDNQEGPSFSYASVKTSIYTEPHENFSAPAHWFCPSGILSTDKLSFSDFEMNQTFGELSSWSRSFSCPGKCTWDGLLGLGPSTELPHTRPPAGALNPFQNMVAQKVLDRNLFSLKLPRSADGKGEILFGAIDHDSYVGELKSFPLVRDNDKYKREVKGRWSISTTTVKLSVGDLSIDLGSSAAVFETEFPYIFLPEIYVRMLEEYLDLDNAGESWRWNNIRSINCSAREMLKNITISLGNEDFVLTPWDYMMEVDVQTSRGPEKFCLSAFMPQQEHCSRCKNHIALGSAFLKGVYSVFDLEQRTVSLATATSQEIGRNKVELGGAQELK